MFNGVSSDVPWYEYSLEMMSAHICTRHRRLTVHHRFTVAFWTPLLCVLNSGEIFSARWMRPLLCMSSWNFLKNLMSPFQRMRFSSTSSLGVVDYSHDRMPNKKYL